MLDLPKHKKIILFDGICNLCNNAVKTVIKNDTKNIFMFVAIQSTKGEEILNYLGVNSNLIDSIVLVEPGVSYDIKATAALKIMNHFSGLWKLTIIFWVFPETFRNHLYDFIAKNRYRWFGKKDQCMIPTEELKAKFLV
ncbi:thiol-disulfide oxidoreductase DCC family protein [Polaribacter tangerinus]|uniref:thiol-disulfide oxidoreductase DCC family protein n=1 Tax=Polaribacter tangerinus TaxID=1920034 RepID=UPI000B4BE057|nr:thiol-disulfide oxidoreductase DCC family protein [Polaribacter tangerinus]